MITKKQKAWRKKFGKAVKSCQKKGRSKKQVGKCVKKKLKK